MDENKAKIIKLFNDNIKGIEINITNSNKKHCGKEGHWLEKKIGLKLNSKNEPDIFGYEMKKYADKITIGDFSASEYLFSPINKRLYINNYNNWTYDIIITKTEFIKYFGNLNQKNNRYSWSGVCVPKYDIWNDNGQTIKINDNNDLIIIYSYSRDNRIEKLNFPEFLKKEDLIIAYWDNIKLKNNINNKFNKNGFFICKKEGNTYQKICFGKPFNFEYFIDCIKNRKIIFDSGMYEGNPRNYSHFRGSYFWDELITDVYS